VRWRRNRRVLWRTAPGYLVLTTPEDRTLEVDGPGGDVWAELADWITEEHLIADLARQYGAEERIVSADVRSLLHQLHTQGYVDRDG